LYYVTYGGGKFVAVGDAGTIVTSAGGTDWTRGDSGSTATLRGVTYGGGMFLAVGTGGTILTSPDSVDWTARGSGTTNDLYAATYGQNLFVAVGANGTITTSGDGVFFDAHQGTVTDSTLTSIVYGQGIFLGTQNSYWIFGSDNGGTEWWGEEALIQPRGQILLTDVAYGNGRFVIVGECFCHPDAITTSVILTSTNTFDWDRVEGNIWADDSNLLEGLQAVAFGRDTFVSVGPVCFGCGQPLLLSSGDGTNWTFRHSRTSRNLYGVTYGRRTFVVVGESGTILQSDPIGPRLELASKSSPGLFDFNLIVDAGDNCRVEASGDLANWITVTNFVSATGTNQFTDLASPNFNRRFYRAVVP
jgi:hypothetical protein